MKIPIQTFEEHLGDGVLTWAFDHHDKGNLRELLLRSTRGSEVYWWAQVVDGRGRGAAKSVILEVVGGEVTKAQCNCSAERDPVCRHAALAIMELAARAAGRAVFPVFQYRYGPATAALDALIEAGLAGQPQVAALETHWNRGVDYYAVPWRGTWAGERGGAVLGHAIHNHDLLCRYFGPLAGVQAQLATRVNPIETEDCAAIALRFANGALATSSVTLGAATDTSRLRLVFERLTAESGDTPYAPATGKWRFIARDPADQASVDAVVQGLPPIQAGFAGYFNAIADALAGNTGREVDLASGRASIELVTAVYLASRDAKEVALPLSIGSEFYASWVPADPGNASPAVAEPDTKRPA